MVRWKNMFASVVRQCVCKIPKQEWFHNWMLIFIITRYVQNDFTTTKTSQVRKGVAFKEKHKVYNIIYTNVLVKIPGIDTVSQLSNRCDNRRTLIHRHITIRISCIMQTSNHGQNSMGQLNIQITENHRHYFHLHCALNSCFVVFNFDFVPFDYIQIVEVHRKEVIDITNQAWWRHQMATFSVYWPFVRRAF